MIEPPTNRHAVYGEFLCTCGAAAFVITRCWIGYGIAVNGVLAHGLSQRFRHANLIVAFDTVCNIGFITFGLATAPFISNWIGTVVIAHGFGISFLLSETMPFVSRLVHFLGVQQPAFFMVYFWCRCCDSLQIY